MKPKQEHIAGLWLALDHVYGESSDLVWNLYQEARKNSNADELLTVTRETLEFWANDLALHGVGDIETAKQLDKLLCIGRVE